MTSLPPTEVLRIEELRSIESLRALAPEWEALAARIAPRLPFHHPWWHIHWYESFAQDSAAICDALAVYAVRRADGQLVAVAPMMLTERPARGPLRMRTLQFLGADPSVTELRGLICRPEEHHRVCRALLAELQSRSGAWDLCHWTGLEQGSESEARVLAEPGVEAGRELPDYVLDLPATWEEFHGGLTRNVKQSLRKCANAPKRDGLVLTPAVVSAPGELEAALEGFFALHRARSNAAGMVPHRDVFASAPARRFLRAVARELAGSGRLRVYQVRHGEKVVASRLAFVLGDAMYLYYSGYDVDYARYSVMTTCVAFALRHAIEGGLRTANLSPGRDLSKTRWRPRQLLFRDALWVSPSSRGRLARRAWTAIEAARSSLAGDGLAARALAPWSRVR